MVSHKLLEAKFYPASEKNKRIDILKTDFWPVFPLYTPWKQQKTKGMYLKQSVFEAWLIY